MTYASNRPKRTFIDLFAGCGGLSLGLFEAGWQGLFAIEKDAAAFSTLKANFISPESRNRFRWPRSVPKQPLDILEVLENFDFALKNLRDRTVDLVCGGPPCQGFSYSGRRKRSDPRNRLINAYVEFIKIVRPRYLLVENVPGIAVPHGTKARKVANPRSRGRPPISFAQKLHDALDSADYEFKSCLIDAADFGVPQRRKRYFGLGVDRNLLKRKILDGIDAEQVIREIQKDHLNSLGLRRKVLLAHAIGDLLRDQNGVRPCEDPESPPHRFMEINYRVPKKLNAYQKLMRQGLNGERPNSTRLANHTDEVRDRFSEIISVCRPGVRINDIDRQKISSPTKKFRIVPLDPKEPSHTVTTLPEDLLHYQEPRILTVRECARIQSFPDWFEFKGKFTTGGSRRTKECPRYTQVGNAVPPLLARAWGLAIAELDQNLRS